MTIFRRPPAKATLRAVKRAQRFKSPSKEQIEAIARDEGVHWASVYRAMRRLTNGSNCK